MNKTKIDWADMTWNPVTGCLHECEYCYARKIANRFGNKYIPYGCGNIGGNVINRPIGGEKGTDPYPYGFEPTFHYYRLNDPQKIKKPQTIFVCSMADLFGEWVPDEWIQMVFNACEKAPQHRYLFLTKNPKAYEKYQQDMSLMKNCYFGASATNQSQMREIRNTYRWLTKEVKTFVSIEPILEEIEVDYLFLYDWIIVGAETGNRKGKVVPEKAWIDLIARRCKAYNVPIFMKESLRSLMGDDFKQEYPWEVRP